MDLLEADRQNPNRHPWEIARAASILSLVSSLPTSTRYADIGAGDMYVTRKLAERATAPVIAVDTNFQSVAPIDGIRPFTDVAQVPDGASDCIFLMDILEHVDEDDSVLSAALRIVRPGGRVVITVPAHRALWTRHDDFLGHRRRYSRAQLLQLVQSVGLEVDECFYFFAIALAERVISRTLQRGRETETPRGVGAWGYGANHLFSRGASILLRTDFLLNRALGRASLPTVGLSICAVCRTPAVTNTSSTPASKADGRPPTQ